MVCLWMFGLLTCRLSCCVGCVYQEMRASGVEADVRSCTSVMRACGRAGDVTAALDVLAHMTHKDEVRTRPFIQ